jgi:hypothetical protein
VLVVTCLTEAAAWRRPELKALGGGARPLNSTRDDEGCRGRVGKLGGTLLRQAQDDGKMTAPLILLPRAQAKAGMGVFERSETFRHPDK